MFCLSNYLYTYDLIEILNFDHFKVFTTYEHLLLIISFNLIYIGLNNSEELMYYHLEL